MDFSPQRPASTTEALLSRNAETGVILLHASGAVFLNAAAAKIFSFAKDSQKSNGAPTVQKIREMLSGKTLNSRRPTFVTEVVSGKRNYLCHAFVLNDANSGGQQCFAVLLERKSPERSEVAQVADEFRLTRRERQTLELLTEGLTSKEIAVRLGVSPSTIKSFLRLIMVKMEVSNRSAILGKILQHRIV